MWTAAGSLLNSLAGRSPRKQTVGLDAAPSGSSSSTTLATPRKRLEWPADWNGTPFGGYARASP
jgi:hypothetical protein